MPFRGSFRVEEDILHYLFDECPISLHVTVQYICVCLCDSMFHLLPYFLHLTYVFTFVFNCVCILIYHVYICVYMYIFIMYTHLIQLLLFLSDIMT